MTTPEATSRRAADLFFAVRSGWADTFSTPGFAMSLCRREVETARAALTVRQAAWLMRERNAAAIVVVEEPRPHLRVPVGIVTDRDLALRVIAADRDPNATTLEDIMTRELATARASDTAINVLAVMQRRRVRRLPVLGTQDRLMGLLVLEDVTTWMAAQMQEIAGAFVAARPARAVP